MFSRFFVFLQYALPRFWLTALVYRLARVKTPAIKDFLISQFVRLYKVAVDDVKLTVPDGFATFNDFFIRELDAEARPIDCSPNAVTSPVDGTVSAAGIIDGNRIFQAKGLNYTLEDLLATDLQDARSYIDGSFATIYLAPFNYHRVHSPLDGEIVAARYVPGDLFSVNAATASYIPGLFRRNERLVLHFKTALGPAVLVFVGALNVGSISTPWSGEIRPRKNGVVEMIELDGAPRKIRKGDLIGWFNMGSTVIVLIPQGVSHWSMDLHSGKTVQMGTAIATVTA